MGNNKIIDILKNKIILVSVIFVLFIGLISIIFILVNSSGDKTKDPTITERYIDPGSGETVITTPNKTPEINGKNNEAVVLGSSRFTEVGITDTQIHKLWSCFSDYASLQKPALQEISIIVASINKINTDPTTSENNIDFEITVDRKTALKARIIYSGLSNLKLEIRDSSNKLLYTSL